MKPDLAWIKSRKVRTMVRLELQKQDLLKQCAGIAREQTQRRLKFTGTNIAEYNTIMASLAHEGADTL